MQMHPTFPTVRWDDMEVTFHPAAPPEEAGRAFAVVVFARHGEGFVLADIPDRGWITPSGRLEPAETPLEAALRETWEEVGGVLEDPREIGYYSLRPAVGQTLLAPAFVGRVRDYGQVPAGSEARGVRLLARGELPALYWRWDPLLEAMFDYVETLE